MSFFASVEWNEINQRQLRIAIKDDDFQMIKNMFDIVPDKVNDSLDQVWSSGSTLQR